MPAQPQYNERCNRRYKIMEETKARFSKRFHHTRLDAIRQYIRQILPSFLLGLLCSLAALPFGLVPFGVAAAATA